MGNGFLGIVALICAPLFIQLVKLGIDHIEKKNNTVGIRWLFFSSIPLAAVAFSWAIFGDGQMWQKNLVLGISGALLGGTGFIFAGSALGDNTAPSPPSSASAPKIGDNNTVVNVVPPQSMGSGNTIVGPTDSHGNTIYNQGGTAIGAGACADPTSIAIGAGANAGACANRKP